MFWSMSPGEVDKKWKLEIGQFLVVAFSRLKGKILAAVFMQVAAAVR